MGTILDYLDWYGDIDMTALPFNEVDALVLCQMSYLDLFGAVPTDGAAVTVQAASRAFFSVRSAQELYRADGIVSPLTPFVLQKMGEGRRFSQVRLSCYEARFDERLHRQFAAVCAEIDDSTVFAAFRGTDDTLVGWREDFEMSFASVPAQRDALEYLATVAERFPGKLLRVGGHSKGGNLAVYASALCEPDVRGRIMQVYDFDGPGFIEGVLPAARLDAVRGRVVRIVPEHCVIGALFNQAEPNAIVKSEGSGLAQHSAMNWQVRGGGFVRAERIDEGAVRFNRTFAQWMEGVPVDRRGEFVDEVFDALAATGATTMGELAKADALAVRRLFAAMDALGPKSKRVVEDLAAALIGDTLRRLASPLAELSGALVDDLPGAAHDDGGKPTVEGMHLWRQRDKLRRRRFSLLNTVRKLRENGLLRGALLLAAGIAVMGNADSAHPVVPLAMVGVAAAYAVFLLVRFFKARRQHEASDPVDAVLGLALVAVAVLFVVFQGALTVFFNLFVGGALLAYGLSLARRVAGDGTEGMRGKVVVGIWCAVALPLGIATLVSPSQQVMPLMFAVGVFAAAKGLFDIIGALHRRSQAKKADAAALDGTSGEVPGGAPGGTSGTSPDGTPGRVPAEVPDGASAV